MSFLLNYGMSMKLAIMQPYFFPYLGYFGLINQTDKFIVFDTPQYIKRGWIQRNRILKPNGEWQYFSYPVRNKSTTISIKEAIVNSDLPWQETFFRQLEHYKKKAPFYREVVDVCRESISLKTDSVVELNSNVLRVVCGYLGIPFRYEIFSEMDLNIHPVYQPDEWALNICKAHGGVSEYWNLIGGKDFFSRDKYQNAGINLKFYSNKLKEYDQKGIQFQPGLSIIDVMMFNSVSDISILLDDYCEG